MAVRLSAYQVADLCLGKPPLRSLSSSATVAAALAALKSSSDDTSISVWTCDHSLNRNLDCVCVGKVCMIDIICFLCREDNLSSPSLALKSPLSLLLSDVSGLVRHVEPSASLVEAIDLMIQGAHNLIVPIKSSISRRKQLHKSSTSNSINPITIHNGQEFCWLTQEDVLRFLLSSIGLFSPIAPLPIETLAIITTEFLSVDYNSPAFSAIGAISRSLADQTSVAVVDNDGTLIGEISPLALACCDESAAAAILTLSAGDLMAYIDCGGPTEEIVRVVEERLKEKKLEGMIKEIMATTSPCDANADMTSSSSSDEEGSSPTTTLSRSGHYSRCSSHSGRMARRAGAEAIVCHRGSSLVAVMIQTITHRVNYVWVIDDDCSVVGIVTFANMLDVFREHLESLI